MHPRNWLPAFTLSLGVLVGLTGCDRRDEIRVYTAPKDPSKPAPTSATPTAASTAPSETSGKIDWKLPEGWRQVPGERPMRAATLEVGQGDQRLEIVVSVFPGDAGGLAANVNRWRGQVNLPPLGDAELLKSLESFSNTGVTGYIVDLLGATAGGAASMTSGNQGAPSSGGVPTHIVGAVITEAAGRTWFVKATGTPAVVDPHRDAIVAFAKSFHVSATSTPSPAAGASATPSPSPAAPIGMGPSAAGVPVPHHGGEMPKFTLPEGWTPVKVPPPLLAGFDLPGASGPGKVKVTLSWLPGNGGGALPNVNRWRQQLGMPSIVNLEDQPIRAVSVPGARAALLELVGPSKDGQPGPGMDVVMIVQPDRTWFVKMTGPAGELAGHKASLVTFVGSLQLPGANSAAPAAPPASNSASPASSGEGRGGY